ncbi:hypothetical protein AB0L06_30670 [Spirillospora sp. NPDC052269]
MGGCSRPIGCRRIRCRLKVSAMYGRGRRDRLPGRRARKQLDVADLTVVDGADVALAGFFSARQKDHLVQMDAAAEVIADLGGRVVERFVQRRGVSAGGVRAMTRPYSSRTLVSSGKVREIAAACQEHGVDVVVFVNALTHHQQRALSTALGRPTVSLATHGE